MEKEKLVAIIQKVQDLGLGFEDLKNYTDETFRANVADIRRHHQQSVLLCENLFRILPLVKEGSKFTSVCEKCTQKCTGHFINISSGLQYHDIIQQKLEHIVEINHQLLEELKTYKDYKVQKGGLGTISLLHEITTYFTAQLDQIRKEYISSFEDIKKQYIKLKFEVREIDEISWKDREASHSSYPQSLDLNEHIESCWTFDTEIIQKIIEINSGIETKELINNLMQALKEISMEPEIFRFLSSEKVKEEAIEELSQIFTMEAERQLWKNIFHSAGFTSVLNYEEEDGNNIDLF